MATLIRRGGVAHGDASLNPSGTSYNAVPPSSTYKGPKVAGTYGGFVGVFVAVGIVVLVLLLILFFLRLRTLRRQSSLEQSRNDNNVRRGAGFDQYEEEAFEMPATGWDQSTVSLAPPPRAEGTGAFYGHPEQSQSQDVGFEGRSYSPGVGEEVRKYDYAGEQERPRA